MEALLGKTPEEITQIIQHTKAGKFAGKQICDWIYKKNIQSLDEMTNIASAVRQEMSLLCDVGRIPYIKEVISKDGTRKYLFLYQGEVYVEAVLIFSSSADRDKKKDKNKSGNAKQRITLCISTQAGCRMGCSFCATGKSGLARNLTAHEIINIYHVLNEHCSCFYEGAKINNIVFMGMGEPLDNFAATQKSLLILTSDWGYGFPCSKITVSTCGFMPKMKEFLDNTSADVAISLHSAIPEQRRQIMPVEKAYPIKEVVELLRQYDWKKSRHLTFEYIVFKNLNDKAEHVNAIAKLLNGLPCRINLIAFNTVPGTEFKGASTEEMNLFADKLRNKGFNVLIRKSKGSDISAACGLLSAKQR